MKNSGIEWIGEIPDGWCICKVKNIFLNRKRVVGEQVDDYERLALTLNGVIKRSKEDSEGLQTEHFEGYQILEKGELVFKLIDLQNIPTSRVGLSPYTGIVSPAYITLSVKGKNNNKFAYYYFFSMYLRHIFNQMGSDMVRSCLNAKDLLELPYFVVPITEQQKIADILDEKCGKIDKLIENEQKQIEKMKEYKQSVITSAVTKGLDKSAPMKDSGIDWIGKIPESWTLNRIKYVCEFNPKNEVELDPMDMVGYVPMECIKNGYMENREILVENISSGLTFFADGDIVMAKVTPCFENGNIAIAQNLPKGIAFGSSELFVFRSKMIYDRWLFYFLRNNLFMEYAKATMTGTGGLKRVSPNFVYSLTFAHPSIIEQQQIADYLDEKCGKIDEVIFIKQRKIEKLQEYKKSLIYEYVTGKKEVV